MSMWLKLVKVSPETARELGESPELLESLLSEDAGIVGVEPERDVYGYDHRLLSDLVEGRAAAEGEPDWRTAYPWMAAATGEAGDDLEDSDLGYGPAFLLTPSRVTEIAKGLTTEGWAFKNRPKRSGFEEFDDLGPFFTAAAHEGKAVLGGIT